MVTLLPLRLPARGGSVSNSHSRYIPWNVHEPNEGEYMFAGAADVHLYLSMAQGLGLNVIVRPGPFLATEWDFGGFPAWLLKDRPNIQ